jgi:hypothetical protein
VTAASAAGRATGDRATIAFYRQSQLSYRNVPAVQETRRGYLSYTVSGTSFRWQPGKPSAGYKAATESVLVLLSGGRITKYVDTVRATGLPSLTIIEDATGLWAALNDRPGACYYANPRTADVQGWNKQLIGVVGKFAPMQRKGGVVVVRSSFPWGKVGRADEIDRISATTKHFISSQVHVTTAVPYTFTTTDRVVPKPALVLASAPHC